MARKLEVEILGDSRSLERAFKRSGNAAQRFNVGIGTIAKSALVFGAIGAAADVMAKAIGTGVDEWKEQAKVAAQTNAVIASTGGAAKVTAKEVSGLAGEISRLTGIDDEAIQQGENLLLTFKNVKNELGSGNQVFDRATKAAIDLSTAGFGSISSTSKQLGKALNDPIKGMTALSRAGVTFSEAQKKTVKGLVETGNLLGAQKLILAEVESQVGGSAKAYGRTLPGALARLRERFKNTFGGLVGIVARPLADALDGVNRFVDRIGKARGVKAKFNVAFEGIQDLGRRLFDQARAALDSVDWQAVADTARDGLFGAVRGVADVLDSIDWGQVGTTLGRLIAGGFRKTAEFLESVDWSQVGRKVVQGISNFLKGVDWKAVATTTIKLLTAALNAALDLLLGLGKELGKQLMAGIGAGVDAGVDFVLRKLLAFVNKVLGITGFLGRFDPFKGVREKVQRQLKAMEGDTRSTVGNINAELAKIKDVSVSIKISTLNTVETAQGATTFGLTPLTGPGAKEVQKEQAAKKAAAAKAAATAAGKAAQAAATAAAKVATAQKAVAQKAAAAAKKAAEARDKAFASLMDSLGLRLERAEVTKSSADNLAILADQEKAVRAQIAAAGRSTTLDRELFRIEQERRNIAEQRRTKAREDAAKTKAAALAAKQSRQFRALGLSGTGDEIVPGTKNLKAQFASLTDRIADSPGAISSKLTNRLAGVKKLLAGAYGTLEEDTRAGIRDLFAAIRGEFDSQAGRLGPDLRRIQIGDKIAEALGFTRTDLLKGLPSASSSSARAPATQTAVGGQTTEVNVYGNVVTNDPEDFLKQMQRRAGRTTGSSRGRFPGQSLGLG